MYKDRIKYNVNQIELLLGDIERDSCRTEEIREHLESIDNLFLEKEIAEAK